MFNPFLNPQTGKIEFKYSAIRDVCFILPSKCPEQLGSIIIPDEYRENFRNEYGIILSVGPGCYIKKFKKWIPTIVKVGDLVVYDPATPWIQEVTAFDGNKYIIKIMGERDISGIIKKEQISGN